VGSVYRIPTTDPLHPTVFVVTQAEVGYGWNGAQGNEPKGEIVIGKYDSRWVADVAAVVGVVSSGLGFVGIRGGVTL